MWHTITRCTPSHTYSLTNHRALCICCFRVFFSYDFLSSLFGFVCVCLCCRHLFINSKPKLQQQQRHYFITSKENHPSVFYTQGSLNNIRLCSHLCWVKYFRSQFSPAAHLVTLSLVERTLLLTRISKCMLVLKKHKSNAIFTE